MKAVGARLKELNPGFDGAVVPEHRERRGARGWSSRRIDVSDLSPLRALTKLKRSRAARAAGVNGKLIDLSPLAGCP